VDKGTIVKLIKETVWYRQATDSTNFYLATPALAVTDEFTPPALFPVHGRKWEGYYVKKTLTSQAREFMDKSRKSRDAIDDYCKKFRKVTDNLTELFQILEKSNIHEMDEKILLQLLGKFDDQQYEFWYINWLVDKFDPEGFQMLKGEIEKAGIQLQSEEVDKLTYPIPLNFMDKSEIELYELAARSLSGEQLLDELKKYARKYFYIKNSWYLVTVLTEKDFLEPIKKIMELGKDEIMQRIEDMKTRPGRLSKERDEIIQKYSINVGLCNIFYMYQRLAEMRDLRKEYVLPSNHYYHEFAKRFAGIHSLDVNLVLRATSQEVINYKDIGSFKRSMEKRDYFLLAISDEGYTTFDGEEAKELLDIMHAQFIDTFEEIKGSCASKGKVEGRVKIVCGHAHFSKFNEGDILVAPMTRPEYVPLMKKASAIITDEGGITSHAAIVSRELKIPCIVGTQVATRKLMDGDLVEVDAEKGIVRKIK